VDVSVVPTNAQRSPCLAAHSRRTVWVPAAEVVTAVPDTLVPSATASTTVVVATPSMFERMVPPIGIGVGVGDAVGEAMAADAGSYRRRPTWTDPAPGPDDERHHHDGGAEADGNELVHDGEPPRGHHGRRRCGVVSSRSRTVPATRETSS
jgi:hypothetical protein